MASTTLKTPREALAAAKLIASACESDEIKAIVARQLLRSIEDRFSNRRRADRIADARTAASRLVRDFDSEDN